MRPRDWFLVGVRLIGVWALFRAFEFCGQSWACGYN